MLYKTASSYRILSSEKCGSLKFKQWTEIQCLIDTSQGIINREEDLLELRGIVKSPTTDCLVLQCLKDLTIANCSKLEYLFSASIVQSLRLLEELNIQSCNKLKSVFMKLEIDDDDDDDGESNTLCSFPNLKTLKIGYCQSLKSIVAGNNICLEAPALEVLHIDRCPALTFSPSQGREEDLLELRGIVKGPTTNCLVLQCLKDLTISDCSELEYLFSTSIAQTLKSLEELNIRCDELKSVFMKLKSDDDESNTLCSFPNLKTLKIGYCRSLKSIVAGNNICLEAPALEVLHIDGCPALTFFTTLQKQGNTSSTLKELTFSMKNVYVEDAKSCNVVNMELRQRSPDFECITLGNFEQLFQLEGGYLISSLEKVKLEYLMSPQVIWKGPIHVAVNLRELEVHNCDSLQYIFPIMLIRHLPQLNILKITSCANMKQIIDNVDILASSSSSSRGPQLEMKFPQLKQIILKNLSRLESFSPVGYHLEFPCLELLKIKECIKFHTSFIVDYLTLTVHAKTHQESKLDDAGPSQVDVLWKRRRPTSLPMYVEDAEEISPLN